MNKEIILTRDTKGWAIWPSGTKISLSKYKRPVENTLYSWVDEIEEWSDNDCEVRGGECMFDLADELLGEDFVRSPDGQTARRYKLTIQVEEVPNGNG